MAEVVVQVNGKLRGKFSVAVDISEEEIKKIALSDEGIQKWILDKPVKKFIYLPGKLVNIVV